jgi:translation initiation factor 5
VEVFKKVQELGVEKKHKAQAVQVLAQTLFTSDIITEIPGYLPIFQKVCRGVSLLVATDDGQSWI